MSDETTPAAELLAELADLRRQVEEQRARLDAAAADAASYRELIESANTIVLRWDLQGAVTYLNDFGLRLFGYAREELVGRPVIGTIVPETDTVGRDLVEMIAALLARPDEYVHNENENMRRDGTRLWITWRNRALRDPSGRVRELLSFGMDTTERKRAEQALRDSEERFRFLAEHDNLTGLFNTRYLYEQLPRAIAPEHGPCSAIFMDLDRFKQVVDTYGHLNGSRVIQEVAATVRACVADPAFAVAYAGDEIVIVLPGSGKREALAAAATVQARVGERPFLADAGQAVRLTASLGVATYPDDAGDMTTLLAAADTALFAAKAMGRNHIAAAGSEPSRTSTG